ncbi:unnamed protein product, partial [Polarella glacialis]
MSAQRWPSSGSRAHCLPRPALPTCGYRPEWSSEGAAAAGTFVLWPAEAALLAAAGSGYASRRRGAVVGLPNRRRIRCVQLRAVSETSEDHDKADGMGQLDGQIMALALPALVALCAEPLLSILDTGFVGRLPNAAIALGGVGIATSIFDFVFRCYNFLCVVLVPLVARAVVAKQRGDPNAEDPADITGRVIGLAATLGFLTWATLALAGPTALQLAGAAPESPLGQAAAGYLSIRATALPASLVNTVAIGAFRGQLDTTTPLGIILGQTIADFLGDAVLVFGVPSLGIPAMGAEGAALATAISVWLSCGAFCFILTRRGLVSWSAAASWPLTLREMQPLVTGGFSQLVRTLALQAVLLEFLRTVVSLDLSGLAAAVHQ